MMKRLCYLLVVFALALGWSVNSMAETYSIQPVGKVVKRSGKTMLEIFPAFKDAPVGVGRVFPRPGLLLVRPE